MCYVTLACQIVLLGTQACLISTELHFLQALVSDLCLARAALRGCASIQEGKSAQSILALPSLCLPIGLLVSFVCCWFFGPDEAEKAVAGYEVAILLQGKLLRSFEELSVTVTALYLKGVNAFEVLQRALKKI